MATSPSTVTVEIDGVPITVHIVYAPNVPDDWPDAFACHFNDETAPQPR